MPHEAGPDGVARAPHVEKLINEQLALAFKGEVGKAVMDYLRSISIDMVCGPFASDAELRHLEGMRFIVGIVSQRIAAHHKEQANAGSAASQPRPFTAPGAAIARRRQRKQPLPK
jgi:hypothetical protein